MSEMEPTRRELLKKILYVAPVILTLAVAPSFASAGSGAGNGGAPGRQPGDNGSY
jgi:hypothetical protein